jgi:hypothetical protein
VGLVVRVRVPLVLTWRLTTSRPSPRGKMPLVAVGWVVKIVRVQFRFWVRTVVAVNTDLVLVRVTITVVGPRGMAGGSVTEAVTDEVGVLVGSAFTSRYR